MRKIVFVFLLNLLFLSCNSNFSHHYTKELYVHKKTNWTYAIYMAADNNLERFAIKNLKEIKESIKSNDVNFVVLLDRSFGYDKSEGNWTDAKILELDSNLNINDCVVLELGEVDTTDCNVLESFLNFVNKYYPSNHLALNIWSHGFGVYPDCKIKSNSRSLIQDYGSSYDIEDSMHVIEFSKVLKNFCKNKNDKIDILQFDCCLMQMLEILWELNSCAKYIIGSQTVLPGNGSNYKELYKIFTSDNSVEECVYKIVDVFKDKYENSLVPVCYSAFNMNNFSSFIEIFNLFVTEIINDENLDFSVVKNQRENLYKYDFNYKEYVDFYAFVMSFESLIKNKSNLNKLLFAFENIKVNSVFTNEYKDYLCGLGMNIPFNKKLYSYYIGMEESYLDIYNCSSLGLLIEKICI